MQPRACGHVPVIFVAAMPPQAISTPVQAARSSKMIASRNGSRMTFRYAHVVVSAGLRASTSFSVLYSTLPTGKR